MHKLPSVLLVLWLVALSPLATSCELTTEYREARAHVLKETRYAYEACIKSVNEYRYWLDVAQCEQQGRAKTIGGGCQHVAAHQVVTQQHMAINDDHCKVLQVSNAQFTRALEDYVKLNKITTCKAATKPAIPLMI